MRGHRVTGSDQHSLLFGLIAAIEGDRAALDARHPVGAGNRLPHHAVGLAPVALRIHQTVVPMNIGRRSHLEMPSDDFLITFPE